MKIFLYSLLIGFLLSCSNISQQNDPIPQHDTFIIKSNFVNEDRVINVWKPINYNKDIDSLPVMYMADGGIKEDFPHIANTLSKLIQEKKIKPLLLVGIENTERRRDLTGFTEIEKDKEVAPIVGGSENFRKFIKNELIPEISKRYSTTNEKSIIGESLSGLFVMETFFLTPELFDNYIAFDPSLWWNNHYLVRTAKDNLKDLPKTKKHLWYAGSSATDIFTYTQKLQEIFKTEENANLIWKYSDEPKESHSTIFRATKEKAIIWTLNH